MSYQNMKLSKVNAHSVDRAQSTHATLMKCKPVPGAVPAGDDIDVLFGISISSTVGGSASRGPGSRKLALCSLLLAHPFSTC